MKQLLILFMGMVSLAASAQEMSKNSFGLMAGAGSAMVMRASLAGAPDFDLNNNFEFGANYYRQIGEKLKFETGLFYHYNQLVQKPAVQPDIPRVSTKYDIHLVYLPLFLRYNFTKHFFVNGGGLVDMDFSNSMGLSSSKALNSLSGLGTGIGIGGELGVSNRLYLQINPYLNLHGALLVERETYPERMLDAGIKIGLRTK